GKEKYTLQQSQGVWRLTKPVQIGADTSKANPLADDLSRLEVVEFVNNTPKPEELEKYGLGKSPPLSATLTFTDKKKKPETLLVGKPREGKPEFYANLAWAPAVFVVKKDAQT